MCKAKSFYTFVVSLVLLIPTYAYSRCAYTVEDPPCQEVEVEVVRCKPSQSLAERVANGEYRIIPSDGFDTEQLRGKVRPPYNFELFVKIKAVKRSTCSGGENKEIDATIGKPPAENVLLLLIAERPGMCGSLTKPQKLFLKRTCGDTGWPPKYYAWARLPKDE